MEVEMDEYGLEVGGWERSVEGRVSELPNGTVVIEELSLILKHLKVPY